jgi:hypothetical protein
VDTGPHNKSEKGNVVKYRGFKKSYLVRIIEELLEWKSSGSGLGNRN